MGVIIKIKDDTTNKEYYLEWSSVVDSPTTYGLEFEEFKEYYKKEYGENNIGGLDERLKRVEENGCSSFIDNLKDFLENNRAGENESHLDMEGILNRYCRQRIG